MAFEPSSTSCMDAPHQSPVYPDKKKRVRIVPGGGEPGLIWVDQRLHWFLALNVFPEVPLAYR